MTGSPGGRTDTAASARSWPRLCSEPHPAPALRLVCLPYAGAGAAAYTGWGLPAELAAEVWALQPPGREDRQQEAPLRRMESLLDEYARQLSPFLTSPYALFGHSMGALLAYELVRRLRCQKERLPEHLFLAAHRAPDRPPKRGPMSGLPDAQLLRRLLEMVETSRSAIRDPDLLLFGVATLRVDLRLCEEYRYEPDHPLRVPITCFAAIDDSEVDPPDIEAWGQFTTGNSRLVTYSGGHLFLRDHRNLLLDEIAATLTRPAGGHSHSTGAVNPRI